MFLRSLILLYSFVNTLLHKFFNNSTSIVATKPKSVGQGCSYFSFLSFIECEIQFIIYFRIIIAFRMIDCRRDDTVVYSFNSEYCFDRSGGPKRCPVIDFVELIFRL